MRQTRDFPSKFFTGCNLFSFATVMTVVLLVPLLIFMMQEPWHHGTFADLPRVSRPVSMPGALCEDAMMVTITRDGRAYLGSDAIYPDTLPEMIIKRVTDRGVERKVYITADARAHWGSVKPVLDGVRSAGILRVAFLVNQRRGFVPATW